MPMPGFQLADGGNAMGDIWSILPERNNDHPAPFPVEIPLRCIEAAGAQSVLDPFAGSGTTLVAARMLGKAATGIELSVEYVAKAEQRLAQLEMPLFGGVT